MKSVLSVAVALMLVVAATAESAAQDQLAGRWQCRNANQSLNNNAYENWIYEFVLLLNANSSFQAQGNYNAQTNGFAIPFMAEGKWGQQQAAIAVQGVEHQQNGVTQQFFLLFTNVTQRSMSSQYQSANGKLLTYCER